MQTQDAVSGNGIGILLSDDATEAYVSLQSVEKEYTREEIEHLLSDIGVTTGIHTEVIDTMLAEKKIGKQYLVAESAQPVDGEDGWYEFLLIQMSI